jgi:glycosyltransferase involved in cell wall biosynthesis
LLILGDGSERAALERQAVELGLQDSVLMPGLVRDPERWLQHAQLYVLSSRFEGFPNALLEAMQCGVAVAAFDCPSGPGEIVRHEQTGLLVPAGDVDALAAAIARLAADADLRQRLGARRCRRRLPLLPRTYHRPVGRKRLQRALRLRDEQSTGECGRHGRMPAVRVRPKLVVVPRQGRRIRSPIGDRFSV